MRKRSFIRIILPVFLTLFFASLATLPLAAQKSPLPLVFDGSIENAYPVRLVLQLNKTGAEGFYYYKKYARPIKLSGKLVKGKYVMKEYVYDDTPGANIELTITGNKARGFWYQEEKFNKATALRVDLVKTTIKLSPLKVLDKTEAELIKKEHLLSLQWLSTEWYGLFTTYKQGDYLFAMGIQNGIEDNYADKMTLDGIITEIKANHFTFVGDITSTVASNNHGKPCLRKGPQLFKRSGERSYWRLQKMEVCDGLTDYIDVYLSRNEY